MRGQMYIAFFWGKTYVKQVHQMGSGERRRIRIN